MKQINLKFSNLITTGTFNQNKYKTGANKNEIFFHQKCNQWLTYGIPKLSQLNISNDQYDLFIEEQWRQFIKEQSQLLISEKMILQQRAIHELLVTEVSFIRQMLVIIDVFITCTSIFKSSQVGDIFYDIDIDKLYLTS
ncbi:unnamed protein product [Rotaria sp. Silwood1]|nr:unnamed protein product [Rotaria sp. Silwood1]